MKTDWKNILTRLISFSQLHARFLNTISLMEYMGARKIIKSQKEGDIDSEVLAHINEEVRHARVFKKLALKLSGGKLTTYKDFHLLAGQQARNYIQSVDQSVASLLEQENPRKNYFLSTLLIEERASQVYPFYAKLLEPLGFGSFISNVFKEEQNHLEQVRTQIRQSGQLRPEQMSFLYKLENRAFEDFIEAVQVEIDKFGKPEESPIR